MLLGKLKYCGAIVLGTLAASIYKAANPEEAFIFLGADWVFCGRAKMVGTVLIYVY